MNRHCMPASIFWVHRNQGLLCAENNNEFLLLLLFICGGTNSEHFYPTIIIIISFVILYPIKFFFTITITIYTNNY